MPSWQLPLLRCRAPRPSSPPGPVPVAASSGGRWHRSPPPTPPPSSTRAMPWPVARSVAPLCHGATCRPRCRTAPEQSQLLSAQAGAVSRRYDPLHGDRSTVTVPMGYGVHLGSIKLSASVGVLELVPGCLALLTPSNAS